MSDASAIAAWWGASIATVVLLWDAYKWKRAGAVVLLRVKGDMRRLEGTEPTPGLWLMFTAANVGDRPTTLENLHLDFYRNWWQRVRNRPDQSYLIKNPGLTEKFPCKLEPGATWTGICKQNAQATELVRDGYVKCCLHHSSAGRPVTCPVRLRPVEAGS